MPSNEKVTVNEVKGVSFRDFEPEHAFAFRDFEPTQILQRKFFSDFNFGKNMTDTEILSAFKFEIFFETSTADLENNSENLLDLSFSLDSYLKKINRHCQRLEKYSQRAASIIAEGSTPDIEEMRLRYKRGRRLRNAYFSAYTFVDFLKNDTEKAYKELESIIKRHCRKIFSERLKSARQSTGLTQKAFAKKVGMSQNGFSLFETGQRDPSIPMLIRLSKLLNRSADWLLGQTAN